MRHTPSGRWIAGLSLSMLTAISFGILPIALKGLLDALDACTVTWYRFVMASGTLALFLIRPGKKLWTVRPDRRLLIQILLAGLLMSANYLFYVLGLAFISPNTAQVVVQLAPLFLLIGSLVVYREPFTPGQWLGLVLVVVGLALFFNWRLSELFSHLSDQTIGALFIVACSLSWALYGLIQKNLLRSYSSATTILFFYLIGALVFLPLSNPLSLFSLNSAQLILLALCGLTSLTSYVGFAEALNHWAASRVSAALAIVPILTVIGVNITTAFFPGIIPPETLSGLSLAGAALVVIGSMIAALVRKR